MLWFFLPTFIKLYTVFTFPTVTYNTVDQISFGIEYCDRQNNGHVKMSTFSAPGAVDGDHTWPRGFRRSDGGSREGKRESPQQPVGIRWGRDGPREKGGGRRARDPAMTEAGVGQTDTD